MVEQGRITAQGTPEELVRRGITQVMVDEDDRQEAQGGAQEGTGETKEGSVATTDTGGQETKDGLELTFETDEGAGLGMTEAGDGNTIDVPPFGRGFVESRRSDGFMEVRFPFGHGYLAMPPGMASANANATPTTTMISPGTTGDGGSKPPTKDDSTLVAPAAKGGSAGDDETEAAEKEAKAMVKAEDRRIGAVGMGTLWSYTEAAGGGVLLTLIILSSIGVEASFALGDWWITRWIQSAAANNINNNNNNNNSISNYTNYTTTAASAAAAAAAFNATSVVVTSGVVGNGTILTGPTWFESRGEFVLGFGLLGIGTAVFNAFRVALFAKGTVSAARGLHADMLSGVLHAPVLFFDTHPTGRILNRFAGDVVDVEQLLPHFIEHALICLSHVLGILGAVCAVVPWCLVGVLPLGIIYIFLQTLYRSSAREMKRLQALASSPVASLVSETMSGRAVVRAFNMNDKYRRLFQARYDDYGRCEYTMHQIGNWQHLRVQFIGALLASLTTLICVLTRDQISTATAGFAINFAIVRRVE